MTLSRVARASGTNVVGDVCLGGGGEGHDVKNQPQRLHKVQLWLIDFDFLTVFDAE